MKKPKNYKEFKKQINKFKIDNYKGYSKLRPQLLKFKKQILQAAKYHYSGNQFMVVMCAFPVLVTITRIYYYLGKEYRRLK